MGTELDAMDHIGLGMPQLKPDPEGVLIWNLHRMRKVRARLKRYIMVLEQSVSKVE